MFSLWMQFYDNVKCSWVAIGLRSHRKMARFRKRHWHVFCQDKVNPTVTSDVKPVEHTYIQCLLSPEWGFLKIEELPQVHLKIRKMQLRQAVTDMGMKRFFCTGQPPAGWTTVSAHEELCWSWPGWEAGRAQDSILLLSQSPVLGFHAWKISQKDRVLQTGNTVL